MLKTACFLTGENYALLSGDTPQSKKKVIAMAIAMLVPTMLWIISGFLLVHNVLGSSIGVGVLAAAVSGALVFIIEKLIIMSTASKGLAWFRVSLGICVAVLGSLALDEVIFKDDIDVEVARLKVEGKKKAGQHAGELFMLENRFTEKRADLDTAVKRYNDAVLAVVAETDGSGGTGNTGVGNVARFKREIANERQVEMVRLQQEVKMLDTARAAAIEDAEKAFADSFNSHALLVRIKAMYKLVFNNFWMGFYYFVITAVLFLVEFLVVILKMKMATTNYERRLKMIEDIGIKRIEFLASQQSPLNDPGVSMSYYDDVRKMVGKSKGLFN